MKVVSGLLSALTLLFFLILPAFSSAQSGLLLSDVETANDPEEEVQASGMAFTLNPTMVTVGSAAGFTSFSLGSACGSWAISWAPNWITVTPSNGSNNATITIQYQENTNPLPRTAVLTVIGCGMSATFTLIQNGNGPACPVPTNLNASYIHYSVFTLVWDSMPGALAYQTRTRISGANTWLTGNWATPNKADWYNVLPNALYECQVRDSCAAGAGPWSATYTLNTLGANDPYCFSFGTSTEEWIQAVQYGMVNNNSGNNLGYRNYTNFTSNVQQGQSFALNVTPGTNNGTHPVYWRVWVDLNRDNDFDDAGEGLVTTTGNDQTPLNVSVPIPSSATLGATRMRIMMGISDITSPCNLGGGYWDVEDYTLNITAGTTLNVSPDTFSVSAVAGSVNMNVSSNCQTWSVVNLPPWITANPSSGSNSAPVALQYQQNNSTSPRTTVFQVSGCGISRNVTLTQAGSSPTLTVSPATFNLQAGSGWSVLNIQSNCGSWAITGAPAWLILTPASGANNGTVVMQYLQNNGTTSRSATLTITGCGITKTVTVTQAGMAPTLNVMPTGLNLPETAGATALTISSNCSSWSISGVPSWMQLSAVSGGNSATINIDYSANTAPFARTADLVITGCGLSRTIQVKQEGVPLQFTVNPTVLNVGSDPGTFSFSVQSNCPAWNVTDVPAWLDVSPVMGANSSTVVIQSQQNAVAVPRSATLTVSGCGAVYTFVINQSAAPISISANPLALDYSADGDSQQLSLSVNCDWIVANAPSWIVIDPPAGAGSDTLTITALPHTDSDPRVDTITLSICGGLAEHKIPITQAGVIPPPAPWVVDSTGENHTVIVPDTAMIDFLGNPLEVGDRIGVFYDSLGALRCAGYMEWSGATSAFTVFGNDAPQPARNGMMQNELFKWRIWRVNSNKVLEAIATYEPVGTAGIVSHTDRYAADGISMLHSLTAVTSVTNTVSLTQGWNLISSHVMPKQADMLDVFDAISDKVIIVKNGSGTSTIPSLNLNNIGNWDIREGYQVKTNEAIDLLIVGDKVQPANTPIPLTAGWQIIAYLRDKPQDAAEVFSGVAADIEIVKDNAGKSYIPAFNINAIGLMYPGRGYKVKALAPVQLIYAANFTGNEPTHADARGGFLQHFVLDSVNTGNNATLVIPAAIAGNVMSPGDEVGVFTPNGVLCGAAIYAGSNLPVTVWGDDATTSPMVEGMLPGEAYHLRVWIASSQQEYIAGAAYAGSDGLYQADDLEILSDLDLVSTGTVGLTDNCAQQVYPNPASDVVFVRLDCGLEALWDGQLIGADGRVLASWPNSLPAINGVLQLPLPASTVSGTYLLRLRSSESVISESVIIQR